MTELDALLGLAEAEGVSSSSRSHHLQGLTPVEPVIAPAETSFETANPASEVSTVPPAWSANPLSTPGNGASNHPTVPEETPSDFRLSSYLAPNQESPGRSGPHNVSPSRFEDPGTVLRIGGR